MRVARWRWVLILVIVVVAGCLPSAGPSIPAAFTEEMSSRGQMFSVASASLAEERPDAVVQNHPCEVHIASDGTGGAGLWRRDVHRQSRRMPA
jgi:hypothetical protein